MTIAKAMPERKQIFGWANTANVWRDGELVSVVDKQGELIDAETLEKVAYSFVNNSRQSGLEHQDLFQDTDFRPVGQVIESMVFTKEKQLALGIPEGVVPEAWWIGVQILDDNVWSGIMSGVYKGFSIQGSAKYENYKIPPNDIKNYALPTKEGKQ